MPLGHLGGLEVTWWLTLTGDAEWAQRLFQEEMLAVMSGPYYHEVNHEGNDECGKQNNPPVSTDPGW